MKVSSAGDQLGTEAEPEVHYCSVSLTPQPNKQTDMNDLNFYDHIARQERGSRSSDKSNKPSFKANISPDHSSVISVSNKTTPTPLEIEKHIVDTIKRPQNADKNSADLTKKNADNKGGHSPHPAEISGSLAKNSNRVVVRPIAFRPVVPSKRNDTSSPDRASFTPVSHDEGYSSYDTSSRACSNSISRLSKDSDTVYASPIQIPSKQQQGEHTMISDTEFERLLQEKESEIIKLRRTMELNENAIFRVHEHKRVEWENQMGDLAQEYHRRLRVQQDTNHDRESELRQVIARLEIDNRQMAVNVQQNKIDSDRQEHLSTQLLELKQRNNDLNNRLARELCDCDRLRQQNKDLDTSLRKLQEHQALGTHEQDRLTRTVAEMQEAKCKAERDNNLRLGQLKQQIQQQEQQLHDDKESFKAEKRKWQQEKEKVMLYQKQLQKTYVQMYKRNNELEQQLCRINTRRLARLETQSLQGQLDRHSMIDVDLESCPESFC